MYRLATKHTEKTNRLQWQVDAAGVCDVHKVSVTAQVHRVVTASSWQFGSAAVPYIVHSTIGLLSDSLYYL